MKFWKRRRKSIKFPKMGLNNYDDDDSFDTGHSSYTGYTGYTGYTNTTDYTDTTDDTDTPSLPSVLRSGNDHQLRNRHSVSFDEDETLEETRQDHDDTGSLLEGEYVTDDDKLCLACHVPTLSEVQKEVTGSYHDFKSAVHQVSTSWIIRDDELNKMAGKIREANLTPKFGQDVPRVKLLKDDLKIGNKRINVYI